MCCTPVIVILSHVRIDAARRPIQPHDRAKPAPVHGAANGDRFSDHGNDTILVNVGMVDPRVLLFSIDLLEIDLQLKDLILIKGL